MFNSFALTGRVGNDAVVKDVGSTKKAEISVAYNFTRKGESFTNWYKAEVWGRDAENAEKWVKKGRIIAVSGTLVIDEWENERGKGRVNRIQNATFKLIDSKKDFEAQQQTTGDDDVDVDNIPF